MAIGSVIASAGTSGLMNFLIKGVGAKLVVFVVVMWLMAMAFHLLMSMIPAFDPSHAFDGMSGSILWALNVFRIDFFLQVMLSAYATAFLIKRLPFVG